MRQERVPVEAGVLWPCPVKRLCLAHTHLIVLRQNIFNAHLRVGRLA